MKTLEIEWSTGANMTGYYSGTESVTFDDNDDIDIQEWTNKLLRIAARKLCWHGQLKCTKTTIR